MPIPSREAITALKFSGDGALLAGARQQADVVVWDVKARTEKCRLGVQRMTDCAFSPDSRTVAAWSFQGHEILGRPCG